MQAVVRGDIPDLPEEEQNEKDRADQKDSVAALSDRSIY